MLHTVVHKKIIGSSKKPSNKSEDTSLTLRAQRWVIFQHSDVLCWSKREKTESSDPRKR